MNPHSLTRVREKKTPGPQHPGVQTIRSAGRALPLLRRLLLGGGLLRGLLLGSHSFTSFSSYLDPMSATCSGGPFCAQRKLRPAHVMCRLCDDDDEQHGFAVL